MAEATPTTRLEAVNMMLRAIGEAPVTQLYSSAGVDTPNALSTLNASLRSFLTEGWHFNTEYDYPLPRDEANEITVPSNAFRVKFPKNMAGADPVVRGTSVYDRRNHTYKFDHTIKASIIFGLPFEELPEAARMYVAIRAARKFQDDNIGENVIHRFSEQDEAMARSVFLSDEAEAEDNNMLDDTPDFWRLRGY